MIRSPRVRQVLGEADAIVTLFASGPAPVGHSYTGSRVYLLSATFLGLPAFQLPLMEADGMPVGAQLIGHTGRDRDLCAHAHWMTSLA
jgi:Asp-tRNA(Asn)/Glu-tRNA(Gln) amidotransferase A subunit family amidase